MGLFKFLKNNKIGKADEFTRIFFTTDVHGSEVTFSKLLNSTTIYQTERLILGGDITGKLLIPIITASDGSRRVTLHDSKIDIKTEEELNSIISSLKLLGYYFVHMTEEEFLHVQQDQKLIDDIFIKHQKERLIQWINLVDQKFRDTNVKLFVTGGNDDDSDVLKILNEYKSEHVVPCEENLVQLDEIHTMVSLGVSNHTPWNTPREYEEDTIAKMIEEAVKGIEDFSNVIFNFHVPPYDSTLDSCPELDTSTDPPTPISHGGQLIFKPVGSTAVKDAIKKYQPLLVLCGHIHEARGLIKIGRSVVINPGSEYGEGMLRGIIVNIGDGKVVSWQFTTG
jgi:uncharacterized protein